MVFKIFNFQHAQWSLIVIHDELLGFTLLLKQKTNYIIIPVQLLVTLM